MERFAKEVARPTSDMECLAKEAAQLAKEVARIAKEVTMGAKDMFFDDGDVSRICKIGVIYRIRWSKTIRFLRSRCFKNAKPFK